MPLKYSLRPVFKGFVNIKNTNDMQDTTLSTSTQTTPSLAMLRENIRVRLERFSFSAHTPLEHLREGSYQLNRHNTEMIVNHLELTILDLKYLINDLYWLQWIEEKKQGLMRTEAAI